MRRLADALLLAALCLMTYGSSAAPISVWMALSEAGGAYAEAADALRAEVERGLPGRVEWRVAPASQFRLGKPEPQWVVAVGIGALRAMQDLFAADATPPPSLAILVPRPAFERIADPARVRAGTQSAVFLDQPPARQMELVRLALPAMRRLGILLGAESGIHAPALERAARERGIEVVTGDAAGDRLFAALQGVLPEVDALLAVPDAQVFNGRTAASILGASYRRRLPLIGFSPAYSRAGALVSLFSTPVQVGTRGGELLRQAMAGRSLPPPQWPREFSVMVNLDVARSLAVPLDEEQLAEQLRQKERP